MSCVSTKVTKKIDYDDPKYVRSWLELHSADKTPERYLDMYYNVILSLPSSYRQILMQQDIRFYYNNITGHKLKTSGYCQWLVRNNKISFRLTVYPKRNNFYYDTESFYHELCHLFEYVDCYENYGVKKLNSLTYHSKDWFNLLCTLYLKCDYLKSNPKIVKEIQSDIKKHEKKIK